MGDDDLLGVVCANFDAPSEGDILEGVSDKEIHLQPEPERRNYTLNHYKFIEA